MQNDDKALANVIFAGQGLLVKMLITLEPHHMSCGKRFPTIWHFDKYRLGRASAASF